MIRNIIYSTNTLLSFLLARFFYKKENGHLRILLICFFISLAIYQGIGLFLSLTSDTLLKTNPFLWKTIWTLCISPLEIVLLWFLIYCIFKK